MERVTEFDELLMKAFSIPSFLGCKSRFFLATVAGQLILRCDLCADLFIGMPLNLGEKPFGYYPSGLCYVGPTQTKSPFVGEGFDLCSAARCVLIGPLFWAALAAVASEYRAKLLLLLLNVKVRVTLS